MGTTTTIDWWVALVLLGVSCVGPWTAPLAQMFGLREFEGQSVVAMATYMARKIPESFAKGFAFFVVVPVVLIVLRGVAPRGADVVQAIVGVGCEVASIATLPLFWVVVERPPGVVNVMGEIFVVDLATMYIVHAALVFGARALPPWTLACGPLFGMARYLRLPVDRPQSLLAGVAALYINVGSLYSGYRLIEGLGYSVFTQTAALGEWAGYELYAGVNVIAGFVLLCASTPAPRGFGGWRGYAQLLDTVLYVILCNGNVAAGWIASRGVWRPPLARLRGFRCASQTAEHGRAPQEDASSPRVPPRRRAPADPRDRPRR